MNKRFINLISVITVLVLITNANAQTGSILREYWNSITGSSVTDLTQNTNFPNSPTGRTFETKFEAPVNIGDDYGQRMRGFIFPPTTGNYYFWISSDDKSELWLSTDDNPANKIQIAKVSSYTGSEEWTKAAEQKSAIIYLEAGKKYYIEALHKEASGNDNLAVGWQLPDNTLERPIPANRLEAWQADGDQYSNWQKSTKVYFDTRTSTGNNITAKVSSFPILIRLNTTNFDFSQTKTDGSDIRFSGQNGIHLPYEIERWDASNQLAEIWVKTDTIYPENNTQYITMYWGKSDAVSKSLGTSVFTSSACYKGVWHLNSATSATPPTTPDAADNNTGSLNGTSTGFLTSGLVGQSFQLNGTNQYVSTTNSFCNINTFTISLWFKTTVAGGRLFGWGTAQTGLSGQYDRQVWMDNSGLLHFGVYCGGNQIVSTAAAYNDGSWHNVVARLSSSGMFLYIDGILKDSKTNITGGENTTGYWRIGYDKLNNWSPTPTNLYYTGLLDEVEVLHSELSSDKIKLIYASQRSGQTLVNVDASYFLRAPSNFNATAINNSVNLSWTDNSGNETGFSLYRTEGASAPVLVVTTAANIQTYTDNLSGCGRNVSYSIKAINAQIESPTISIASPVSIVPCAPTNVIATASSTSVINVSWSGTASLYALNGSVNGGAMTEIYRGSAASFSHTGLTCHTTWSYQVIALNSAGNSGPSPTISATTGYCPINTPSNLTADNTIPLTIKLAWNDNSDNEDGFKVFRKEGTGGQFQEIHTLLPNVVTYSDQNLKCNTSYTYYVVAFDLYSNNSGQSNNVTSTTLYCGADKSTSELILISGMAVDSLGNPLNGTKIVSVKMYSSVSAITPVYEEAFENTIVKNGYFAVTPGLTGNVAEIIRTYSTLFYDVIIDGHSIHENVYQPLTASPYSIKNSFNQYGVGSPIGLVYGPIGASYIDTQNQALYMKFGVSINDWVKVSQ